MDETEPGGADYLTELSALYEISSIPTSLISHQELGRLVLDKATRLLGAPIALLYRWEGGDCPLRFWMARGVPFGEAGDLSPKSEPIRQALDEGRPVTQEGTDAVRALGVLPANHLARQGLCVPIRAGGVVRALLCAFRLTDTPFARTDLALFGVLADRTGMALETIRLFAETEQRYHELQGEIAERKAAEEALRVSEERFALAVRGSNDGIWDWDIASDTLYWSPRVKELLGYADDDELDVGLRRFETHLHPDDRERMQAAIEAHLKDRVPYDVEQRLRTKSGEYRWFRARGQAIWDEDGRPLRMAGSSTDITERKRAEESIRLLSTAVSTTLDAISVASAVDSKLLFCNDAFLKQWRVRGDYHSLSYADCFDLGPGSDALDKAVEATMRGGWTGELTAKAMDGHTFPVLVTSSPVVHEDGGIAGMLGVFKDITERKHAEEALKEYSERLEEMVEERTEELREAQERLLRREKLAVLGELAGGVGHELRNPLGAIKNAAYFLKMALKDPEPEVKETLEIVEKEVGTSERIITSLLDFARARAPSRRKVDLNDAVRRALSRAAAPENVEVVGQLDERLPRILADPDQLGQVFGNITVNAVQAMPDGGRLVVKTWASPGPEDFGELGPAVKPSQAPGPGWVAVSFTDTGVGIPEEDLRKVFEPLFTTKARGVGLGLAVTRTLVEGHGGTIELESEEGKGTTFTVRLPVDRGPVVSNGEGET